MLVTIFLAFTVVAVSIAGVPSNTSPRHPKMYASEIFIPIGKTGNKISLLELSKISRSGLEKITGKKMNFWERHAFHSTQKKLKKGIDTDGVIADKKLQKIFGEGKGGDNGDSGFNLGGFALGFLLGPIGVLVAYLLNDDKKKNRIKWAWIGFAASILLYLLLFLSIL
jgi:hypothetical protein